MAAAVPARWDAADPIEGLREGELIVAVGVMGHLGDGLALFEQFRRYVIGQRVKEATCDSQQPG